MNDDRDLHDTALDALLADAFGGDAAASRRCGGARGRTSRRRRRNARASCTGDPAMALVDAARGGRRDWRRGHRHPAAGAHARGTDAAGNQRRANDARCSATVGNATDRGRSSRCARHANGASTRALRNRPHVGEARRCGDARARGNGGERQRPVPSLYGDVPLRPSRAPRGGTGPSRKCDRRSRRNAAGCAGTQGISATARGGSAGPRHAGAAGSQCTAAAPGQRCSFDAAGAFARSIAAH